MASDDNNYGTQWAGQFYVAAELTKRGYIIGFTLGNAQETDILVHSPNDNNFSVEVKSMKKGNFWMYRKREVKDNQYYIFTIIGDIDESPEFYILSSKEAMAEYDHYYKHIEDLRKKKGVPLNPKDNRWGAKSTDIKKYKDEWNKLPN